MRTSEMLIVFGALMALIALVAVAIDWVDKPLRNRRFIPRIYRYGDEMPNEHGPVDQAIAGGPQAAALHYPEPYAAPPLSPEASEAPPAPAGPTGVSTLPAHLAPGAPPLHTSQPFPAGAVASVPAASAPPAPQPFSDSVDEAMTDAHDDHAGARIASTVPVESADAWQLGMALDSRVRDESPTAAEKAERFWKTFAHEHGSESHFDDAAVALMADGKAPRRRNPRTGSVESVELVGLRAASHLGDVRMMWPDASADPWSGA